jgi:hypothetical protein
MHNPAVTLFARHAAGNDASLFVKILTDFRFLSRENIPSTFPQDATRKIAM